MFKTMAIDVSRDGKMSLFRSGNFEKLGRCLFLAAIVSLTALVLSSSVVLADNSAQETAASSQSMAFEASNESAVENISGMPRDAEESGFVPEALVAGAVVFWLVLAGFNLRRRGVKDFQTDNRIASPLRRLVPE